MLPTFQPSEKCKGCGNCCKGYPGSAYPENFKNADEVIEALKTGEWCIDWWEAVGPLYFIRPAMVGRVGKLYDPAWGGVCIFLQPDGCKLLMEKRPAECRALEPKDEGCEAHFIAKKGAGLAWQNSYIDLSDREHIQKLVDG